MQPQQFVIFLLLSIALTVDLRLSHLAIKKLHAETVSTNQQLPWNQLYEKEEPKKKQTGGSRSSFCPISLGALANLDQIWHQQPLFIWQGRVAKMGVWRSNNDEIVWSQAVKATDRSLVYGGEPLQPGESYDWIIWDENLEPIFRASFQIVGGENRDRISSDLNNLQLKLQQEKATKEKIAYAKAEYFASRQMWADALQEAYSVENPSEGLSKFRQLIPQRFCQ